MAVKVISQAFGTLARIYKMPGQLTAPGHLELATPVQVIHDIAPSAERLSRFEMQTGTPVVMAALNTTTFVEVTRLGLFNLARDQGLDPALTPTDVDIWLYRLAGQVDTSANFESCIYGPFDAAGEFLAYRWTQTNGGLTAVTDAQLVEATNSARALQGLWRLPLLIHPNGGIRIRANSGAGGACTVTMQQRFWITPRGTLPPKA